MEAEERIERFFMAFVVFLVAIVFDITFMNTLFTTISSLFSNTFIIAIMQFSAFLAMAIFTFYIPYYIITTDKKVSIETAGA